MRLSMECCCIGAGGRKSERGSSMQALLKILVIALTVGLGCGALAADVDQAALQQLEQRTRSGEIPGIHGVVVVHHGKTIAEWYIAGEDETIGDPLGVVQFGPDTLHDIRS